MTKQLSTEAGIIEPLLLMNAKIVLTLVSITIIIYDPLVAFISITLFYILMYIFVRTTLVKNGKILPKTAT